jgi:hypothetical protein
MDALLQSYASASDDEGEEESADADGQSDESRPAKRARTSTPDVPSLPPPPLGDGDGDGAAAAPAGPVRQLEHVDGHFAVHVFLPVVADATLRAGIDAWFDALAVRRAAALHRSPDAALHVSLSRTAMLPARQIEPFVDALRVALRPCAGVGRVALGAPCALANDTRTRFFAALELRPATRARTAAEALVDAVDAVMGRYELPRFYAERRLHFSVGWSLAPLPGLPPLPPRLSAHAVGLGDVACRVGERTTTFRLRST